MADKPHIQFIQGTLSDAVLLGGACIVLAAFSAYMYVQNYRLANRVDEMSTQTLSLSKDVVTLTTAVNDLTSKTTGLSQVVTNAQQNIDAVRSQVGGIEQTVGSVTGTVGNLQKLAQTDQELLAKYSKVYFLSENYAPKHTQDVPPEYVYSQNDPQKFVAEAWPFLKSMMDSAQSAGSPLVIKSAYRSFAEQQSLKSSYRITYGAGTANSFSADQGYSEHQLGTTVDFVASRASGLTAGFDKTAQFTWLTNNAHRYGFTLSYPAGNSHYIYEPWHWRFVGVQLATDLYNKHARLYDLTQRELDPYLVAFFDQR
jgi:LAS superfamily LD-carboxypeptidase LdcB